MLSFRVPNLFIEVEIDGQIYEWNDSFSSETIMKMEGLNENNIEKMFIDAAGRAFMKMFIEKSENFTKEIDIKFYRRKKKEERVNA